MDSISKSKTHWFFDAVPTKDLGFTKQRLDEKESDYVTVTLGGKLQEILALSEALGLKDNDLGRKLTTPDNMDFMMKSCYLLNQKIMSGNISIWANLFYKSKIPDYFRKNYENYQASDLSIEKGLFGMQSRALSQPNWLIMQREIIDRNYPSFPVVCIDNENEEIYKPMAVHFHRQLKGRGQIKVQSTGILELVGKEEVKVNKVKAETGEKKGYVLADYLASIVGKELFNPDYITHDFFRNVNRFESKIYLESKTDTAAMFTFNTSTIQYRFAKK